MSFRLQHGQKDSGIAWVGDIPSNWQVKRAKFLFTLARRRPREGDGIVTAFRDGQVTLRSNRRTDGFTNAEKEIGYQGVRQGDLVIHAMDAFAGAIGVSESDGKCSPVYACCVPSSQATSEFYAHCVRTMATTGYIQSLAKGIRERSTDFRWSTFAEQFLPVPPETEQEKIGAFITRETARIDNLIARKTRFIELLAEKRQALITHAVTKGLNPDAKMKDSGVEWLGEVPEHWTVKRLRFLCDITTGSRDTVHAVDGGEYPFFVRSPDVLRIDSYAADCEAVLTPGDGDIGKIFHHFVGKFDFHQRVYMMSNFREVIGRFFYYYIKALFAAVTMDGSKKTTVDSLRMPVFRNFQFVVPNQSEQERVVSYLDRATVRIDNLIAKTERSIELLREHRTALITAAVTGKLDLRLPA
jgi:type I restriction enzyme S subunit